MKLDIKTKPTIEEDKVVLDTEAREEVSKENFIKFYKNHRLEANRLENQIFNLKTELDNDEIEETEELKELKEKIDKVNKLLEKKETAEKLRDLEEKLSKKNEMIKSLEDTYKKLIEEMKKNEEEGK